MLTANIWQFLIIYILPPPKSKFPVKNQEGGLFARGGMNNSIISPPLEYIISHPSISIWKINFLFEMSLWCFILKKYKKT